MKNYLAEHRLAAILIGAQALVVISISIAAEPRWPWGDELAYLLQGVMLRLGLFPPNPARPVIYPFILSLIIKAFGLDTMWMRLFQGAALVLTSALLYRLAYRTMGKRPALFALVLFTALPEPLFFTQALIRETFTALFLVAALNAAQLMVERERPFYPVLAGITAGLLVLIKPEFGPLLLIMALVWGVSAARRREWRKRLVPWVVCGAVAIATILPAIAAAYRAYGELVYVSTYGGYNWMLSYCGDMGDESLRRDFYRRDWERYTEVNPLGNRVLFDPASTRPFRQRDAELMERALECMGQDPGRTAKMYGLRAVSAALYIDPSAKGIYRSEFHDGPGFVASWLKWQSILVQALILFALAPGLIRLVRDERGWNVAAAVFWYVIFYATVTYSARFKVSAWPVFVICGAAGAGYAWSALEKKTVGRWIAAAWVAAVIAFFVAFPWLSGPVIPGPAVTETQMQKKSEKDEDAVKVFMINLAGNFERAGKPELLKKEFIPFAAKRLDSVSEQSLSEARDFFDKRGMDAAAGAFRGLAAMKAGSAKAR